MAKKSPKFVYEFGDIDAKGAEIKSERRTPS
jgi:hypothetical protein